jgi:beta-lactamase class A
MTCYSRALQGRFFRNKETLTEFRRILSFGDAIWLVPLPLGGSAFVKGGNIDVPGYHALCAAGGMLFDDRWAYFCFTINGMLPKLIRIPKRPSSRPPAARWLS